MCVCICVCVHMCMCVCSVYVCHVNIIVGGVSGIGRWCGVHVEGGCIITHMLMLSLMSHRWSQHS